MIHDEGLKERSGLFMNCRIQRAVSQTSLRTTNRSDKQTEIANAVSPTGGIDQCVMDKQHLFNRQAVIVVQVIPEQTGSDR